MIDQKSVITAVKNRFTIHLYILFTLKIRTFLYFVTQCLTVPGAVYHLLAELLQVFFPPTGHGSRRLGGGNSLLRTGARVFAGTQTTSSPIILEKFLPLFPQTLNTSAVSEGKGS